MENFLNIVIWGFLAFCLVAILVSFIDGYRAKREERTEYYRDFLHTRGSISDSEFSETQNCDGAPTIPIDHK